jgi:alkylhydroperoxidase family enzyme
LGEDTNNQPRIPPRPVDEWTEEVDEAFASLRAHAPGGGRVAPTGGPASRPKANILGIYAWHPAFARGWLPFSHHLRFSTLPDRVREMVIIRTAWLGFGEYEWSSHVWMSKAAGHLTEAEIDALAEGPDAAVWPEADAAIVRAVDEMCADKNVTDATWSALEKQFSREQLIDFVFTVGTYDMHCTVFNTLGLDLDPGMTGFPDSHRRGG